MRATIKAYYKAATTKKAYIIQTDISTNYYGDGVKYNATNNLDDKLLEDYTVMVISTEDYYSNLDVLQYLFNELNQQWSINCYYYEWDDFLAKYNLSSNQFMTIKRLLRD